MRDVKSDNKDVESDKKKRRMNEQQVFYGRERKRR